MDQIDIFSGEADGVPEGFRYAREFISEDEERDLVHEITRLPLEPFQFGVFEGKRKVASFGFSYDYTLRRLRNAARFPAWLEEIIDRVEGYGGLDTRIRQALCTEYDIGAGIGWHRDKPQFDLVFGLSLGAPCKLRFRRRLGSGWQRHTIDAEPRSLYLMAGPSREVWEHSIPAVEGVRYSVTFRTMKANKLVTTSHCSTNECCADATDS